jgi:hypothetical protein
LRVHRVADGEECLALDLVALHLQLDGVVVAACRRRDFGDGRDLVRGANAVLDSLLFEGIGASLLECGEGVGDMLQAVLAGLLERGEAVTYVADAVAVKCRLGSLVGGVERC